MNLQNTNQQLLAAATTPSNLNFQIPSISIKLDRENYSLWRTTIVSALETFDLESYILDPQPPPETLLANADGVAAPNPDYVQWKKRDRFVLLWIKSTLTERALALVARSTSSQMAWLAIERTFQAQTRARRMAMKAQLQTLTKGSSSMLEYIEKKRSIADSLAENLHAVSDEDLISHILNGLDSSYGPFTAAFMMKTDALSVDDLVGLLLQEEARLEQEHTLQAAMKPLTNPSPPPSAPAAHTASRSGNRNAPPSHFGSGSSSGNRNSDPQRRRRVQCQLYSKPGHEAIDCLQRSNHVDYPPPRPNPRDQSKQAHVANYNSPSTVVDPSWYFDTGAIDHASPDIHKLAISDEYSGDDKLQVGNGQNNTTRRR